MDLSEALSIETLLHRHRQGPRPVTQQSAGNQRRAERKRERRRQVNLRRVATGGCWSTKGHVYSKAPLR